VIKVQNKKHYGIIYCATNRINSKKYIGQTTQKLNLRINNHLTSSRKENTTAFHKALNKYGKENFVWIIIDYGNNQNDLDNKEKFWIKFYNTYKQGGYNMTRGGQDIKDFSLNVDEVDNYNCNQRYKRKILVYNKFGNFIKSATNQITLANELSVKPANLNLCLRNKKNSIGDYIFFYTDTFTEKKLEEKISKLRDFHEVVLFDAKTKCCLGVWTNVSQCSRDTGYSLRMMQKQLKNPILKPRKFIIMNIKDLSQELLDSYNCFIKKL